MLAIDTFMHQPEEPSSHLPPGSPTAMFAPQLPLILPPFYDDGFVVYTAPLLSANSLLLPKLMNFCCSTPSSSSADDASLSDAASSDDASSTFDSGSIGASKINDKATRKSRKLLGEPYQCDNCSLVFRHSWSLIRHKKAKHSAEKQVFPCKYCYRTFPRKDSLMRHQNSQINGKCPKGPGRKKVSAFLTTTQVNLDKS